MKKIFTLALAAAGLLTANAADYVVYNNGVLGEGLSTNHWWNCSFDTQTADPTDASKKVFSVKTTDGGAAGSMGLITSKGAKVPGELHNATLHFSWYADKECTIIIRLTGGGEYNTPITVTSGEVGKWNEKTIDVATDFPQLSEYWSTFSSELEAFPFSVVLENAAGANTYFSNIYYSNIDENWQAPAVKTVEAAPVPTTPANQVMSLFSSHYEPVTTFSIGGWGQSTAVTDTKDAAGNEVEKLTNFNYLGWELQKHLNVSECNKIHVDYFPEVGNTFAFTIISPGKEKVIPMQNVETGKWNSWDVDLSEWNDIVDMKDIFQIKYDQGGNGTGYLANVYFYNSEKALTPEEPFKPSEPAKDPFCVLPAGELETGSVLVNTKYYSWSNMSDVTESTGEWKDMKNAKIYTVSATGDGAASCGWDFNSFDFGGIFEADYDLVFDLRTEAASKNAIKLAVNGKEQETAFENTPGTEWHTIRMNLKEKFPTVVTDNQVNVCNGYGFAFVAKSGAKSGDKYDFTNVWLVPKGTSTPGYKSSGVAAVEVEEGEAVYFNLQGQKVENPENGLYIRVAGNKATKVLVK